MDIIVVLYVNKLLSFSNKPYVFSYLCSREALAQLNSWIGSDNIVRYFTASSCITRYKDSSRLLNPNPLVISLWLCFR